MSSLHAWLGQLQINLVRQALLAAKQLHATAFLGRINALCRWVLQGERVIIKLVGLYTDRHSKSAKLTALSDPIQDKYPVPPTWCVCATGFGLTVQLDIGR